VQSVRHLYKMTSFNSRYNYRAMLLLQKIEMTSPDVLIKMAKSR